jgi:hypothetical protein
MTVRCPRCTRPLTNDECVQCGPAATGVFAPSLAWPGEQLWPHASRRIDDLLPPRDRRPLLIAAACLTLAILLVLAAA